ncbi:BspA family leucine-rich repeat surface protein [Mycoplasma mycoides subsp. capri]|uniref:BspA family leucine-rich repeat surface protein n=1 Tax=Mycoplasma mycoides TaxID=2102 RepID=UPI00223F789D|nr:BspA family leucine-rich repeat surface protein [Mycoplasma mycoides]QVJ96523.1 BspA family leucine-rich repeat surface protein [Mycoplasma mycoides subsp. capri]QVJ97409.1 BspA family leucine-rich repeat surface protein [Mycoplasma mycoides subsp. capri]QVK00402.1 BspA family leucine-rich repeat surface protein [Mycoplasma mycoides subsp. capri]QVK01288.1 BspA family leucine-rich repeat surface protein [Mycoplasma mycoides subsp. capri]
MKKVLTLLTSFSLIATSSVLVVSCKTNGLKGKLEKSKDGADLKEQIEKEEKNDNKTPDSSGKMTQNNKPKNDEENKNSASTHNVRNILSEIYDERPYIKKYYEWIEKSKEDNLEHFINPYNSNEILILGYEKSMKNNKVEYTLKQIPTNVNKVPKTLPKNITSLESTFKNNVNQNIEGIEFWDTSNVNNMYQTFYGAKNFNQNISSWNTDKVENMSYMFAYANSFKQDLSKWKATKSPFPTGFANDAGFKDNKTLWPQFKNKN